MFLYSKHLYIQHLDACVLFLLWINVCKSASREVTRHILKILIKICELYPETYLLIGISLNVTLSCRHVIIHMVQLVLQQENYWSNIQYFYQSHSMSQNCFAEIIACTPAIIASVAECPTHLENGMSNKDECYSVWGCL